MTAPDLDRLSPYGRFLHHCQQGELAYQVSPAGAPIFYPRLVSPDGSGAPLWRVSKGLGTVYSVTLVHQRDEAPYALALVDLDEGFRMLSRIDTDAPDAIAIGARLCVGFRSPGEGQPPLPVFTPAGDAS
jgi:uncharacterized OB-fold protein